MKQKMRVSEVQQDHRSKQDLNQQNSMTRKKLDLLCNKLRQLFCVLYYTMIKTYIIDMFINRVGYLKKVQL